MATALIGPLEVIGGNLDAQAHFSERHSFRTVEHMKGRDYDLVVCAPAPDAAILTRLAGSLPGLRAARFVLISTTDVYARPEMVDEDAPLDAASPRAALEQVCSAKMGATVIRVPLLFGAELSGNVLFDLMNDRDVDGIHPDGVLQYYGAANLWRDLNMALERAIPLLNVACEPIPTRELALRCFGRELTHYPAAEPPIFDVRSKYAPLWGGNPFGYLYAKERVLQEISAFIERERAL